MSAHVEMLDQHHKQQWQARQELISYKAIFADLEEILQESELDLIVGKAHPHVASRHLFKDGLFCAAFYDTSQTVPQDLKDFAWGHTAKQAVVQAIERFKGE